MDDRASGDEQQRTLAWLDSALERARAEDRMRLVRLLNLVQTEVLFDVNLSESALPARATVNGPAPGANRGT